MRIGAFSAAGPFFPQYQTFAMEEDGLKRLAEIGRLPLIEIGSMPAVIEFVLHTPTDLLCS